MDKEKTSQRRKYEAAEEEVYDFFRRNERIQENMWKSFRGNKAQMCFKDMDERISDYKYKISTNFEDKYDELAEYKATQEEDDSGKEEEDQN
ncbi:DUF3958 family protein [Anaerosacchariphilus polymeriproducens]|uniref:Uncharacterized protein n=1 Tax=Anaerosacchariphilus polymeriproducens TaxID=1812858 RepID=A0A371AUU8_9FIRM|nr:DUF3958 family protein [Anaerosacchariphilus polymeriproducens]RDU23250.1 hypothetical protein DWV06_10770 [Anaerosacchariphilus polymeriproducens]